MEHLGLREDGGCSFGGRDVGAVSESPNVAVVVVPHGVLVAVEEASGVGKSGVSDVLMRPHGRHHVQEVELAGDELLGL